MHRSTPDPEARLYRKADGREAKLSHMGHAIWVLRFGSCDLGLAVMENRNGLAVSGTASAANGSAERRASEAMLKKKANSSRRITAGEDKGRGQGL